MCKLDIPMVAVQTSIVAGNMATSYPMNLTLIKDFATRFGALFDEYAIVGADFEVRMSNVVNPQGIAYGLIDEKTSAVPNASAANSSRLDMAVNNYDTSNHYHIQWKARDYLDLEWQDIGTTYTPAWLKFYASTAETGTNASTTANILITGTFAYCFRGYKQH
jgi:hypothetical protein